ncbi:hypothetical protein FIBSPDRAFT_522325 [Athelia psychrophila]|uniref:Uncharacterized protein n=1 Tax=Athelia psychrophila TaxID=1759441 RepID=A0A166JN35_9AGAM|nr:hypothetical protein FIBSPDRAFT_522325 [Fibularhizoctonia sp. CBS 109695]
MPAYADDDDVFGDSGSRFLSPSSPHKSPGRLKSSASPRGTSSLPLGTGDNGTNGQHSLAHELAVALMPEPSAGSKLLADEFGIDYDEGAEGIDEEVEDKRGGLSLGPSFADEVGSHTSDAPSGSGLPSPIETTHDYGLSYGSPMPARKRSKPPEQDAMDVLARNLDSTDKFLGHLRRLDVDSSSSNHATLEKLASEIIRRLNETARDRETQVRELLGYEREFRKIAGEAGGSDVLSQLDELDGPDELTEKQEGAQTNHTKMESVREEPNPPSHRLSNEWEMDPELNQLGDEDDYASDFPSPIKDSFPPPPAFDGPMTPSNAIPQMAHIRTFTTSLVSSLTTLSEHAQVNGAATTEAGRKIRALKNKIGGWRTDWDGAERSRLRIEKWEAGIADGDLGVESPVSPTRAYRRVDGRKLVQEHLRAFELALAEAGQKTQAIMAAC